jgi:hypothetical protein
LPANIWKILNKNSPGTSGTFAADDWDMPGRYFSDVDLSATAPASIKTNTSFWDNRLRVWNPAKTKSYRIRGLAIVNDYDLTLPLLSSNDEIVGLITSQTLQNKIINVNNNTIKHGTTNAIGDLLVGTGTKYDRLAMGSTGGYVLAVKNDLSGLEWVAAPGGGGGGTITTASNVGTGGVGIFKQVSGTGLQFKKLNVASGGLVTVTDDTANSEVDLKITGGTDGQFLKTVGTTPTWSSLSSQYGRVMPDGSNYGGPRYGVFLGGAADGDGLFSGLYNEGTITNDSGTTLSRTIYTSPAVVGSLAGFSTWSRMTRRSQSPRLKIKGAHNPSTHRGWFGFVDADSFPTTGTNPLNNRSGALVGFSESDSNFICKWNNGSAVTQSASTAIPKDTAYRTAEILLDEATASVSIWFDGTQIVNASTTQVPGSTTSLSVHAWDEAVTAAAAGNRCEYAMLTFP